MHGTMSLKKKSVSILSFSFFSVVQEVSLLQLFRAFFHRVPCSTCSTHYLTSKNHKSNRSVSAHRSCAFCSGCVLLYLNCIKRQKWNLGRSGNVDWIIRSCRAHTLSIEPAGPRRCQCLWTQSDRASAGCVINRLCYDAVSAAETVWSRLRCSDVLRTVWWQKGIG